MGDTPKRLSHYTLYFAIHFFRRFLMRRFMLSVCACLLAVLWVGLAANPAPVSANPPGPVN